MSYCFFFVMKHIYTPWITILINDKYKLSLRKDVVDEINLLTVHSCLEYSQPVNSMLEIKLPSCLFMWNYCWCIFHCRLITSCKTNGVHDEN